MSLSMLPLLVGEPMFPRQDFEVPIHRRVLMMIENTSQALDSHLRRQNVQILPQCSQGSILERQPGCVRQDVLGAKKLVLVSHIPSRNKIAQLSQQPHFHPQGSGTKQAEDAHGCFLIGGQRWNSPPLSSGTGPTIPLGHVPNSCHGNRPATPGTRTQNPANLSSLEAFPPQREPSFFQRASEILTQVSQNQNGYFPARNKQIIHDQSTGIKQ
ncbi:MAG: hypothetical protein ACKV19_09280 [Verrucomicrobiales bacterium]